MEHIPGKRAFSRRHLLGVAGSLALGLSVELSSRATPNKENTMNPKPTPQQIAWQRAELSMFLHFGMNTFTNREWGEGTEDPHLFNPTALDAKQWVSTAKEAGFKYVILTAKHHDGFCLWPSRYTEHSVKNSPWKNGKGDVVREFAEACHGAKLKMGLYLSPWDRHEPSYGDSPAYNQHYISQLTELLSNYGEVAEVWFDGANGEGPNGKKQEYDFAGFYSTIRKLQPHALIAIMGPDIRWVGNEDGYARETEWSVQPADKTVHPGVEGNVWWPAECDVSIRPGWFWHENENEKVKSLSQLMDIYYKSVGRNSVLLLNVPPDKRGLLAEPDVARLREFRAERDRIFQQDLIRNGHITAESSAPGHGPELLLDGRAATYWTPAKDKEPGSLTIDAGKPITFSLSLLQEFLPEGQHVEAYALEIWENDAWRELFRGTTIGNKKIDHFPETTSSRIRVKILQSRGAPMLSNFQLYYAPAPASAEHSSALRTT